MFNPEKLAFASSFGVEWAWQSVRWTEVCRQIRAHQRIRRPAVEQRIQFAGAFRAFEVQSPGEDHWFSGNSHDVLTTFAVPPTRCPSRAAEYPSPSRSSRRFC